VPEPVVVQQPQSVQLEVEAAIEAETATPPDEPQESSLDEPAALIAEMTVREKVAGLVVASLSGNDPQAYRSFAKEYPVAGFLLLGSTLNQSLNGTKAFAAEVQRDREFPLLLAVDQEGGVVSRLPGDSFPAPRDLGKESPSTTTDTFLSRQKLVREAGLNVNLGLVADVSPGSTAYIHNRSFGDDPDRVSDHVVAALGGSVPRVAQTLKHFPGHGLVFEDSHKEIPATSLRLKKWRSTHATPFIAGISQGVELVMMAHIRVLSVSKDPASLSNDWVDILRNELGYQGVIITDDLAMLASSGEERYQDPANTAVDALIAGNDLIMVVVHPREAPSYPTYARIIDALELAVISGVVSEDQVDDSLMRVLTLRQSLAKP
jgi:beta-N-acetylhexosaminidase